MPRAFPKEFRDDVVAIARRREASFAQIAKGFGISESCVQRWVKIAEVDDGVKPGVSSTEQVELREAKKRIRLLEIAKQPFYRWLQQPVSDRAWDEAQLINAAIDVHREDPVFGYRFIADELADLGFEASERRVWRVCSQQGIWSVFAKKKGGKSRKAGPPVHDDLVRRRFAAAGPNQLWLTDITEHWTAEGKVYLCAIKDGFSNRIVGYSIDDNMTSQLAVNALRMAVQRRRPVGTIVHSDHGSQFRSRRFVHVLSVAGLTGSMGRVGVAGGNAAMESFFALLQKTFSTSTAGQHVNNSGWRSCPGSRRPTTGDGDREPWAV